MAAQCTVNGALQTTAIARDEIWAHFGGELIMDHGLRLSDVTAIFENVLSGKV